MLLTRPTSQLLRRKVKTSKHGPYLTSAKRAKLATLAVPAGSYDNPPRTAKSRSPGLGRAYQHSERNAQVIRRPQHLWQRACGHRSALNHRSDHHGCRTVDCPRARGRELLS